MPGGQDIPAAQLLNEIAALRQQLDVLSRQQSWVAFDSTGATGDPAHQHATVVIGPLQQITGITGNGLAVWNGSGWTQIT